MASGARREPAIATRSRSRSLGTVAIAHQEKHHDSSDSESAHQSWFPPPSTAPIIARRISIKETPTPIKDLPPIPPVPPIPQGLVLHAPVARAPPPSFLAPPSPAFSEDEPRSPLLERVNSKRKTILSRIEGWWDLNLIEKRQTLFGGTGRKMG
ncbi:hypothetical protein B0T10DRAFT_554959 [Thelonectria olida]|uniref:Uncharacterized protein n=1 Tax=Thelonectria olida TaxID=1576542 RepID=A0A9P9AZM4_9HYPO|nr:hypothetical protein B0T10DRAFT_554959 [Thelonectria olida]